MGTHPIFESDFDCLTDFGPKVATMFMEKKTRIAIYETLFKEGVMVAEKNCKRIAGKMHADVGDGKSAASNLQVIKTLQSLTSRGYVKQNFAWRHFYWILTNEGVEYLREVLHLPPEIVPVTMKKQAKIVDNRGGGGGQQRGGGRVGAPTQAYSQDQRDAYRRDKDANVGPGTGGYAFRGAGRGRGGPGN